jgi:heat shock protein HslJ
MATLKLLILPAALALSAAAPPPYLAHGTEPFWSLSITGNRIVYEPADGYGQRIAVTVRPRAIRGGRIYATRRLTVEIRREGRCNDGMSEREYADTVRVRFGPGGRAIEGCGGALLAPERLAGTGWGIVAIDGRPIRPAENYRLEFGDGRLDGQAGCNRFSGPYSESGLTLRPGAIMSTRMACPEPGMTHERRMLRLLGAPVRYSFADGETLLLSGSGVTARLRRLPG